MQKKRNDYMDSGKHKIEKRKYAGVFLLAVFLVLGQFLVPFSVKAASATLTFAAKNKEVVLGETFSVVVYVDSNDSIGGFEGYISYDKKRVEYVKGGNHVSGGNGLLKISELDSEGVGSSKKYSINFRALKKGNCTFETKAAPKVYNASGEQLSVSSNRLSVSVLKSSRKSSNCNLVKLQISPGKLSPEYSNDVTEYQTEIPYESDMLFVTTKTADSESSVKIQGNENLSEGKNFVHVVVTAQSGAQKDIQIEVFRQYQDEKTVEEENIQESTLEKADGTGTDNTEDEQGNITAEKEGQTITLNFKNSYTVMKLKNDSLIPDGYGKSSIKIGEETITAYADSRHAASEFVLLYLKNAEDETGFYRYDRVEKTIQRYTDGMKIEESSDPKEDPLSERQHSNTSMLIAVVILAAIIMILSIILAAVLIRRKSGNYRDGDE